MLVALLCLLWLAACLGVLSVWVLRGAPATPRDAHDAIDNPGLLQHSEKI